MRPPGNQRFRLDWEMALPAKVFVRGVERGLSKAWDALTSILAPVCAFVPDCLSAEPASDFCSALDERLLSVRAAVDATRYDVCFVLAMSWIHKPHAETKWPLPLVARYPTIPIMLHPIFYILCNFPWRTQHVVAKSEVRYEGYGARAVSRPEETQ